MTQLATEHETWDTHWARAYSFGHNVLHLSVRRLVHFAHAYADICEEVATLVPDLEMTLEAFWLQWEAGDSFEGTEGEHWHLVTR